MATSPGMLCRAAAEDRRSFSETASLVKSRLLVVSLVAGRRRGANHSSTGLASSPIESAIAGTGVVLRVAFYNERSSSDAYRLHLPTANGAALKFRSARFLHPSLRAHRGELKYAGA